VVASNEDLSAPLKLKVREDPEGILRAPTGLNCANAASTAIDGACGINHTNLPRTLYKEAKGAVVPLSKQLMRIAIFYFVIALIFEWLVSSWAGLVTQLRGGL